MSINQSEVLDEISSIVMIINSISDRLNKLDNVLELKNPFVFEALVLTDDIKHQLRETARIEKDKASKTT